MGFWAYPKGLVWYLRRPLYLFLQSIPSIVVIVGICFFWSNFFHLDQWVLSFTFSQKPDQWWWLVLWWPARILTFLTVRLLVCFLALALVSLLLVPIYEWVSIRVETSYLNTRPVDIGFWQSLKLLKEELKKFFFFIAITGVVLIIPGLNLFSGLVAAFFAGWSFCDYPLARRGWTFRQRLNFVLSHFLAVTGYGLWFIVPFLNLVLYPFGVAGGTLLCLQTLETEGKVKRQLIS